MNISSTPTPKHPSLLVKSFDDDTMYQRPIMMNFLKNVFSFSDAKLYVLLPIQSVRAAVAINIRVRTMLKQKN